MAKKLGIIIQARTNSSRFPNKVLSKINDYSIIEIIIKRLKKKFLSSNLYLSTTVNTCDIPLINIAKKNKINYFIGSEDNVLNRFADTANKFKLTDIVRITADCPLVDPRLLSLMLDKYFSGNYDYYSNNNPPSFPDGLDLEIFKTKLLYINSNHISQQDKEHVTLHIKNNLNKIKLGNYTNPLGNFSDMRLTIDYKEDLKVIKKVINFFKNIDGFYYEEIINLYKEKPDIFLENKKHIRNSGFFKSNSQAMWSKARNLIAGGNMLYSKKPEIFSEDNWPTYYSRAKGINIWDLSNIKYKDLCAMGIGTNILGYANSKIDNYVIKNIKNSNSSTFNSIFEIKLAEKLLELNRWASKVKFTRTGAEACSVALRLARCISSKQNVAICGYHGWHDWYLSLNLNTEKELGSFLFENVAINGVNKNLKNSCFSFDYNDFSQLEKLIIDRDIGIVIMEVQRNEKPKNNFLKKIRKLCDEKKVILIFDECTSGFRETDCGIHQKYNINPDLLILGKALGNGYAINAIIGKQEVMTMTDQTFMSSTFWSEQVGLTAGLKTLEVMKNEKSWQYISELGDYVTVNWRKIAINNNLKISIKGLRSIPNFILTLKNNFNYRLFITEHMLSHKILATNTIYLSNKHKKEDFDKYFNLLDQLFYKINLIENDRIDKSLYYKYFFKENLMKRFN